MFTHTQFEQEGLWWLSLWMQVVEEAVPSAGRDHLLSWHISQGPARETDLGD